MTSSNGNIFRVTGPLCGEFTGPGEFPTQRPVARSFGVFFDLRLNKRLRKQPWGWRFETPSWSLWCQCNDSYLCPVSVSVVMRAITCQIGFRYNGTEMYDIMQLLYFWPFDPYYWRWQIKRNYDVRPFCETYIASWVTVYKNYNIYEIINNVSRILRPHTDQCRQWCPRLRLSIKTVFSRYGIPMLMIRRSRARLIFNVGIPILATSLYWSGPLTPSRFWPI